MKIGILATGNNETELLDQFGSFADMTIAMLDRYSGCFSYQVYDVCNGDFPVMVDECDGWIITGSADSVYDRLTWIKPLERLICEIDRLEKPLVGICFGHQIIAQALGARVEKSAQGWGLGRHSYRTTERGGELLGTAGLDLHVIHQDQVLTLPERAQRLASSAFCPNAVLSYDSHILTVQAHPEFTRDYMQALLPAIAPEYITAEEAAAGLASMVEIEADPGMLVRHIVTVLQQGTRVARVSAVG